MIDPTLQLWIGQLSARVTRLERKVAALNAQISMALSWARRFAVIAAIWAGAIWTNANAETKAQFIIGLLSALGG
jgi:hypothetical protein